MISEELKQKIEHLNIWKKSSERAPHKPLLILYVLAQLQNSDKLILPFEDVKGPLTKLLQDFGPQRQSYHPEEPFTRLSRDGIWQTQNLPPAYNPSGTWLIKNHVSGGFSEDVVSLLKSDPRLIQEVAELLLYKHFPETIHEDILTAIGLDLTITASTSTTRFKKKTRSPEFRDRVLKAYEFSCAVCGFSLRVGNTLVAVEAAHIKWFQADGPDTEENGLALCSMHHKLLDRGVFTVNLNRQLIVAELANGFGLEEYLMRFNGKSIRQPVNPKYQPDDSFLSWHEKEVFKGPARYFMN